MEQTKYRAFSFVEILIVITIIGILAIFAITGYSRIDENTKNSSVVKSLQSIDMALNSFQENEKVFPLPQGNLRYFTAEGTYASPGFHDSIFGVCGFVTQHTLPKQYLQNIPLDPRTKQFYGYGITYDKKQFQIGGIVVSNNIPKALIQGTYTNTPSIPVSLIKEYAGPSFVENDSTAHFPYNPYEGVLTARIENFSGNIAVNGKLYTVKNTKEIQEKHLYEGDTLEVFTGGKATIYYSDGSSSELDATIQTTKIHFTTMRYPQKHNLISRIRISLDAGNILNRISKLNEESEFEIYTNNAIASVRGTVFEARFSGNNTTIIVYEGKVELRKINRMPRNDKNIDEQGKNIGSPLLPVRAPLIEENGNTYLVVHPKETVKEMVLRGETTIIGASDSVSAPAGCGKAHGKTFSSGGMMSYRNSGSLLCSGSSVTNFTQNGNMFSWECNTGGNSVSCSGFVLGSVIASGEYSRQNNNTQLSITLQYSGSGNPRIEFAPPTVVRVDSHTINTQTDISISEQTVTGITLNINKDRICSQTSQTGNYMGNGRVQFCSDMDELRNDCYSGSITIPIECNTLQEPNTLSITHLSGSVNTGGIFWSWNYTGGATSVNYTVATNTGVFQTGSTQQTTLHLPLHTLGCTGYTLKLEACSNTGCASQSREITVNVRCGWEGNGTATNPFTFTFSGSEFLPSSCNGILTGIYRNANTLGSVTYSGSTDSKFKNGVYRIRQSNGSIIKAFCDMSFGTGGRTLVLKGTGNGSDFDYNCPDWRESTYTGNLDLSVENAKLEAFSGISFTQVRGCIGSHTNCFVFLYGTSSFARIFTVNTKIPINNHEVLFYTGTNGSYQIGSLDKRTFRNQWISLIDTASPSPVSTPGSPSPASTPGSSPPAPTSSSTSTSPTSTGYLQPNCLKVGFNLRFSSDIENHASVRMGIIGNNEKNCESPDSFIGIGGYLKKCSIDNNCCNSRWCQCSSIPLNCRCPNCKNVSIGNAATTYGSAGNYLPSNEQNIHKAISLPGWIFIK